MLSYDNFLISLKEKLIVTHPLSNCSDVIDRTVSKLEYWHKIHWDFSANTFTVEFEEIPTINKLEYLNHIVNQLGYYPCYLKIYNLANNAKEFPWVDLNEFEKITKNRKAVSIYFESDFDEKLKYTPKILYHCTNIKNISKIIKKGLMPKFEQKGDYRPERVYLSLNYKDVTGIKTRLKLLNNANEYVILKIDTNDIYKLELHKDPRSHGVYTYNHINPKNITKETANGFIPLNQ